MRIILDRSVFSPPEECFFKHFRHRQPIKFKITAVPFPCPQSHLVCIEVDIIPCQSENLSTPCCQMKKRQKHYPILTTCKIIYLPEILFRGHISGASHLRHFLNLARIRSWESGVHILRSPIPCCYQIFPVLVRSITGPFQLLFRDVSLNMARRQFGNRECGLLRETRKNQ